MRFEEFVEKNAPKDGERAFELENGKLLDVDLDGTVYAKVGSMIAYTGDVSFVGQSSAEGGIKGWIKQKATGEGTPVMKAEGTGHVYLADQGKKIQVLDLAEDEEISVNGNDVLAFEGQVNYEVRTIDSIAGISAGGLTNVFLQGPGSVAISTHGDPIVLTPPVRTDPKATVAWSGTTSPGHHADRSLSDMVGQASEETYQLDFTGDEGFVVVQPFEEQAPGQ